MALADYLLGALLFAIGVGGPAFAAWRITRARFRWMATEARIVAWALLTLAFVALTTGIPLVLGLLGRGSVAAVALGIAGLSLLVPARERDAEEQHVPASAPAMTWVAGAVLLVGVTYLLGLEIESADRPITDTDSTAFILPTLMSWVREGSMWDALDFVPGWGFAAYPNTGGLIQLSTLVPWHSDFALRGVNVCFLALGGYAAYALALRLGASRASAVCGAVLAVTLPAGIAPALNAQTDGLAAAGLVAGVLFAVRHTRTGARADLGLAALGLGLAFGTKWYGQPQVLAVLVVWFGAAIIARRPAHARAVVGVGLAAGAIGGVWLIRNLIEFGSPLFPSKALFFDGPATSIGQTIDFTLLDYVGDPDVIRELIFPQLRNSLSLAGALLLVGTAAAAAIAIRRRDRLVLALAVATGSLFFVYAATPNSALGPEGQPLFVIAAVRYAVPAFLLAGACAAWALSMTSARLQVVLAGGGLVALILSFTFYDSITVIDPSPTKRQLALALLAAVGVALAVTATRRQPRRLAGVGIVLAVATAAVGLRSERRQSDARFAQDATFSYLRDRIPSGQLIGVTGEMTGDYTFTTAAFGPDIGNDVRFIGPIRDELLVRDDDEEEFHRRLEAVAPDRLVVAADPDGPARELAWAQAAGWEPVARGPRFTLLEPPAARGSG